MSRRGEKWKPVSQASTGFNNNNNNKTTTGDLIQRHICIEITFKKHTHIIHLFEVSFDDLEVLNSNYWHLPGRRTLQVKGAAQWQGGIHQRGNQGPEYAGPSLDDGQGYSKRKGKSWKDVSSKLAKYELRSSRLFWQWKDCKENGGKWKQREPGVRVKDVGVPLYGRAYLPMIHQIKG